MSFIRNGRRTLSAFFVLVLLSTAFMPFVAAMPSEQASDIESKNIITIESITLSPDRNVSDKAVSSTIQGTGTSVESGTFTMTYSQANGKNRIRAVTGRYSETRDADGSSYTRIVSRGMVYELSMKPLGQADNGTLWAIEETRTTLGKSTTNVDTVVIPTQILSEISENNPFTTNAAKTKIDVPRYAPSDAILIFNDVRLSDIIYGGAILGIIAMFFSLAVTAVIEIVVATVEWQVDNSGISSSDVYLDIYFWPKGLGKSYAGGANGLFVEVDYYYK